MDGDRDEDWTIDVEKKIASGAYGVVYSCRDQKGKQMAVKCIKLRRRGVPCLMETAIMSVLDHPNLNKSLYTTVMGDKLLILQDLAVIDLCHHTRGRGLVNIQVLYAWSAEVINAVKYLHKHGIIHCDIKASNIFMYADGRVKLADFTLSTKVWSEGMLFYHDVCTSTHRAPECMRKQGWSYPLDIWSLGCTLFEIGYGRLLFPYQGGNTIKPEEKLQRELAYLSEFEKARSLLIEALKTERLPSLGFLMPDAFWDEERRSFNQLVLKMLNPDPGVRISLEEIQGLIVTEPVLTEVALVYTNLTSVEGRKRQRFLSIANRLVSAEAHKELILRLSEDLYQRCLGLDCNEESKAKACVWLGIKLVNPKPELLNVPLVDLYPTERKVCQYLKFSFPIGLLAMEAAVTAK